MSKNNKLIKIMLIALLCISICFTIFSKPEKTYASEGTITVKASAGEVIAGNTITVEVKLNNPAGITSANFELIYDGNIFAYVSGMDGSGFNGVIPFSVTGGATEQTEYKWNITFKANQTGTCNFTIKGYQFIDTDVNDFSPACGSASVKVMAVGSDDATLSSIQVGGANLSPAFAKWTLDYKCYVDNSVTSVNIAAASSQGGRVEIAGNTDNLAVGNNYVTITSYAPNGKAMKYNLNIFRLEPPTEPPTEAPTDPPTEPPASFKVTIDGKEYNVSSEFDAGKVPDGFEIELGDSLSFLEIYLQLLKLQFRVPSQRHLDTRLFSICMVPAFSLAFHMYCSHPLFRYMDYAFHPIPLLLDLPLTLYWRQ